MSALVTRIGRRMMPRSVRFSRVCPCCGKSHQIPVALLGKSVQCMHCREEFVASPLPTAVSKPVDEFDCHVVGLIRAADAQLASYADSIGGSRESFAATESP